MVSPSTVGDASEASEGLDGCAIRPLRSASGNLGEALAARGRRERSASASARVMRRTERRATALRLTALYEDVGVSGEAGVTVTHPTQSGLAPPQRSVVFFHDARGTPTATESDGTSSSTTALRHPTARPTSGSVREFAPFAM